MTQVDLAAAVRRAAQARGLRSGADKQRIRKWELDVTPDPESQAYLATVFDVPAETVTALGWPHWLPGATDAAPLPLGSHSTVPALREALDNAMDRRAFLTYSGTALAALALDWATTDPAGLTAALDGKPVDADLVTWLEETSAKLTALPTEQRQFTAALLDAHLATVTDLIDTGRYTTALGLRLHSLSSSLAQTVGWHRFDQGRHAAAGHFWHSALHSAHAAGDHDMGAGVLSDFAYQATWRGDPHTAVGILQRALTRARHPAARSLLHLRLARAQASLGDATDCRRSLTAAENDLDGISDNPLPAWCAWMSAADLAVDSGQCLLDLGQTTRAHQLIGEGLALLPAARSKTRAVFLTYEAASHLQLGQPDLAAAAARESLSLATKIGAPRCVQMVKNLAPGFAPYTTAQGVPELITLARAS